MKNKKRSQIINAGNHSLAYLLAENGLLSLFLGNRASDFDDFSQMLDIIALHDLASVLCTKNSSSPWGGGFFTPKNVNNPPMIMIF